LLLQALAELRHAVAAVATTTKAATAAAIATTTTAAGVAVGAAAVAAAAAVRMLANVAEMRWVTEGRFYVVAKSTRPSASTVRDSPADKSIELRLRVELSEGKVADGGLSKNHDCDAFPV
jgi:hypothetical protein